MIVKNEKEVITRCLESVLPIIDTWVIIDTGSTDGTQKVIKDFLKDIPGELHERPWVNFGYNRQEALLLAKGKADYLLFMDADDILVFSEGFTIPDLVKDFYVTPTVTVENIDLNIRLVKSNLDWCWEGVVHESLGCKTPIAGSVLEGIKYVYLHDGARGKDPNKAKKDIELLEEARKIDPENSRTFFYLGRSYLEMGALENALECFQKRVQMGGDEEEVFYSNIMIGRIQNDLHFEFKQIEESFLQTYFSRPYRAESLYYLACAFCQRGQYEKGYEILKLASDLPTKNQDYLFVEKWIYEYGILLQYIVCAAHTGRYVQGLEICQTLLMRESVPENVKQEVQKHFTSLHQMNIQEVQKKLVKLLS